MDWSDGSIRIVHPSKSTGTFDHDTKHGTLPSRIILIVPALPVRLT
jgi:hypothetical protein